MSTDVVVASTTDTQESINIAAGLPAEGVIEVAPKTGEEQPKDGEVQTDPAKKTESVSEADKKESKEASKETKEDDDPEKKNGVQKRIDRLTSRVYDAEGEKDRLTQENSDLKAKLSQLDKATKAESVAEPGKLIRPKESDFTNHDDYIEALTVFNTKKTLAEQKVADAKAAETAYTTQVHKQYEEGAKKAMADHEDFEEVLTQNIEIPNAVRVAIVSMRGAGAEIAYQLGKDPALCTELLRIAKEEGDILAVMEFGRHFGGKKVEASVAAVTESIKAEEAAEKAKTNDKETPKPKPVSSAPAPVTPVAAHATTSSVSIDELPYNQYREVRNRQEAARRRR